MNSIWLYRKNLSLTIKEINSKTSSLSSNIEVPTSDLKSQNQTSSLLPSSSSSSLPPWSLPPSSLVSTNPPNPDPISNLTNTLSNISLANLFQNTEDMKIKKEELVTFKLDKVAHTAEILSRSGKAWGQYKNHFKVEYKEPLEYVNKKVSINFDKVDNL